MGKRRSVPPPPAASDGGSRGGFLRRPKLRLTSEYDNESSVFFNNLSCKVFDNLAKLKLSFQSNRKGEVSQPQFSLTSKNFSLQYDVAESDALLKASFEVAPGLLFRAEQEVKARKGELAIVADLVGPAYKLELGSTVPSIGLQPRATLKFPCVEISFQKKEKERKQKKALSLNERLKSHILNGVYTCRCSEGNMDLQYAYKDEQMAFIPSISLPSNAVSCAFKRRFSPSDKLSYLYKFDSNNWGAVYNNWSAVYKHTFGKYYKFKAGYDNEVRLGWASLWVGEEDGKAKAAPIKMKMQIMLQVPQDDIKSSALTFRVKKRWHI